MLEQTDTTSVFIDGLYGKFIEGGITYFFPSAKLQALETRRTAVARGIEISDGTSLILNWLGSSYSLTRAEPFSAEELKLGREPGIADGCVSKT